MTVTHHLSHRSWLQSSITTRETHTTSLDFFLLHVVSIAEGCPPPRLPSPAHLPLLDVFTMSEQTIAHDARTNVARFSPCFLSTADRFEPVGPYAFVTPENPPWRGPGDVGRSIADAGKHPFSFPEGFALLGIVTDASSAWCW